MYAKNRKSRFLLITTVIGTLMAGGIALAGEKEPMVPSPEMTLDLQTRVQVALNLQIEREVSDTLVEHRIAQEFEQVPVIKIQATENKGKAAPGAELHSQLSTEPEVANQS